MKIANRITLSFLTVILISGIIAGGIFYYLAKKHLKEQINYNLEAIGSARQKHIETYLSLLRISMGQMSKSAVLENFLKAPNDADRFEVAFERLERTEAANPDIFELMLLDLKGKVIVSTDKKAIGQDKSTDEYFTGAREDVFIKDAYFSDSIKNPCLAVSAPVFDSQTQELLGVVVGRVDMSGLNKITTDVTGLGNSGEMFLVNKYCYMITPSRFLPDTFLKQKIWTPIVKEFYKNKSKKLEYKHQPRIYSDYRGVTVLGNLDYIPDMQWFLICKINLQEAFAPIAYLLRLMFFLGLIGMSVIFGIARLVAKSISQPIHTLHLGTEMVEKGDLDYKVGTNTKDEIGQLSRSFDAMVESIKHSTTSIDNLNQEISERKKVEKKLSESYEQIKEAKFQLLQNSKIAAMGQLAGGVAHEINNPLTGILNNVQLIKMEAEANKELKIADVSQLLDIMEKAALRCKKITQSLLDISRITSGLFQPVNLNSLVNNALELNSIELESVNITVERSLQQGLAVIQGDPQLLQDIIIHLIANAKWAIAKKPDKKGGIIILKTWQEPENKNVILSVSDNGIGIPEENIKRLFEPFFTTKDVGEGTGLGLALIHSIVTRHKGNIVVESRINLGTTFKITLPYD